MFKRMLMIAMTASLVLAMSACTINMVTGSGKVIPQTRNVTGFTNVIFGGLGELLVVQGTTEGLTIEAEDNIMARIKTEVKNGTLTIGFDRENWQDMVSPTRPIKYKLSVKNLAALELTGAGNAIIEKLKSTNLVLKSQAPGISKSQNWKQPAWSPVWPGLAILT